MDRDRAFTVQLAEGTYDAPLFADATIDESNGTVAAALGWIDVTGRGADEDEALNDALQQLSGRIADGPGSRDYDALASFVRDRGRELSPQDMLERSVHALQTTTSVRHAVTPDEQYQVALFGGTDISIRDGIVTIDGFGVKVAGEGAEAAANAFIDQLNTRVGDAGNPGPSHAEVTAWVREHGQRIPAHIVEAEQAEQAAYEQSKTAIEPIAPEEIAAASSEGVPLVVDFWAEWCAPCRMAAPVLAELATKWSGRMRIRKLDIEEHQEAGNLFGFRSIPTMIVFKDGKEIDRITGFGGREALTASLEPHLAPA